MNYITDKTNEIKQDKINMKFNSANIRIYSDRIEKLYFESKSFYEYFDHYIKKQSEIIFEIKNKLDEDFKKQISSAKDDSDCEYLYSEYYEANDREYEKFKEINYKTMVLQIYSYLESTLRELSIIIKNKMNLTLGYQDIRADDTSLKLFKKYFEKVAGLKFQSEINEAWDKLYNYKVIRNVIAHNLKCEWSATPYDYALKQLDNLIKNDNLLERNHTSDTFNITNEQFLFNFLKLTNNFLIQLFDTIDDKFKGNK